jgi:hypothetical protein
MVVLSESVGNMFKPLILFDFLLQPSLEQQPSLHGGELWITF